MITIRQIGIELPAEFRDLLEVGLEQSLRCLGRRLQKVNAFVSDLNGPKGGVDKHCRIVIHLKRQPSLVIEERDSELRRLIDRLVDRLGQTAARLCERATAKKFRTFERGQVLQPVSDGK